MLETFERSWEMAVGSSRVLSKDPELILYPALSLGCGLIVLVSSITFLEPVFASSDSQSVQYAGLFALLFAVIISKNFWDVALIKGAYTRLKGGEPTFFSSLRAAFGSLERILVWSLWSSTVGVLIAVLRIQFQGAKWFANLLEGAFDIVDYFALPVMVLEGASTSAALSKSKAIAQKTWGIALSGYLGFEILYQVLVLPLIAVMASLVYFGGLAASKPALMVLFPLVIFIIFAISTLEQINRVQIYLAGSETSGAFVIARPLETAPLQDGVIPSTRAARLCPRCFEPMKPCCHSNVQVDSCAKCGGIWLDRGEMEQLLKAGQLPPELTQPAAAQSDLQYRGPGQRECPVCEVQMMQQNRTGLSVDHCRQCGGTFFDRGELSQLNSL